MRGASFGVRCLYGDRPRRAVRLRTSGAQFAIDGEKRIGDAESPRGLGEPVDAIALGDAVQIESHGLRLAGARVRRIELENLMGRAARLRAGSADAGLVGRAGAKTPGTYRIGHADVEGAARDASDLKTSGKHVHQRRR